MGRADQRRGSEKATVLNLGVDVHLSKFFENDSMQFVDMGCVIRINSSRSWQAESVKEAADNSETLKHYFRVFVFNTFLEELSDLTGGLFEVLLCLFSLLGTE